MFFRVAQKETGGRGFMPNLGEIGVSESDKYRTN
jgi:hypothetical protein